jgi:hypothetical protein
LDLLRDDFFVDVKIRDPVTVFVGRHLFNVYAVSKTTKVYEQDQENK